jgi:hypothetical protein
LAGGLNLYGFAGGDPVNFSDPFGLCDPKKDPDCHLVSQATAGVTAGTKAGGKLLDVVGLQWQAGVTVEAGARQTVDLGGQQIENEGVVVAKVGANLKATLFGLHFGVRIGFDSENPDGGFIKVTTNPDERGTFVVSGQVPAVGVGVSGTYKLNPFGVYQRSLPGLQHPSSGLLTW